LPNISTILKLFGAVLLVVLSIFTFVSVGKVARQVEEQSIHNAAQNYYEKKLFNEIRWGMHSLMDPLMNIQYPAIKFIKVRPNIDCQKEADGRKGYMIEAVLLSY